MIWWFPDMARIDNHVFQSGAKIFDSRDNWIGTLEAAVFNDNMRVIDRRTGDKIGYFRPYGLRAGGGFFDLQENRIGAFEPHGFGDGGSFEDASGRKVARFSPFGFKAGGRIER